MAVIVVSSIGDAIGPIYKPPIVIVPYVELPPSTLQATFFVSTPSAYALNCF